MYLAYVSILKSGSTMLLGLFWTLSIVLYVEDKKYPNVSETGSVSVLLSSLPGSTMLLTLHTSYIFQASLITLHLHWFLPMLQLQKLNVVHPYHF
jgi:hypothetical protein